MQSKNLPESLKDSQCVFSGKKFDVRVVNVVGKSGYPIRREAVIHPGAVVILPILDKERIVMIRNERFAIGKTIWELPAGTLEPGEPPEITAGRELIEEIGYQAGNIELLSTFYVSPGISDEVMYSYVAKELTHVGQHLEETENITVEILAYDKALEMVRDGTICDAKTINTLLFYHSFFYSR